MQEKGINIDIINKDDGSHTPLSLAISKKYLSTMQKYNYFYRYHYYSELLIKFLIKNSTNDTLKKQNINGNTSLHIAIIKRDYNTVRLLLEEAKKRGIDLLNIKNRNGRTPFEMLNIEYEEAYQIIKKIYYEPVAMFTKKECEMQRKRIWQIEERETDKQLLKAKENVTEIIPIAKILKPDSIEKNKENIEKIIDQAAKITFKRYNIANAEAKIKLLLDTIIAYEKKDYWQ